MTSHFMPWFLHLVKKSLVINQPETQLDFNWEGGLLPSHNPAG